MRRGWFYFALFFVFVLLNVSCSNSVALSTTEEVASSSSEVTEDTLSEDFSFLETDFVKVAAAGKETVLGTNLKEATINDRPQMKVKFSYDFYMEKHEVTRGEYFALLKNAVAECKGECSDSIPVTNVTFYDAVLFANAKSKSLGLDTSYSYSSVSFDENGNCNELGGLVFHEKVDAFRLPTEAEWVYAASQGWNVKDGWYSKNSDLELHQVCSLAENEIGICDMAGNAMEWVNDWLLRFSDTTLTDFAGAPDGGNSGIRVLKGGCYKSDDVNVNLYSRGDVYPVTSSTKAAYVGFRLAYGGIPNALWVDDRGNVGVSKIDVTMSFSEIKKWVGSLNAKLVFRNEVTENLAYVDFSQGLATVVEIRDTLDAYHPDVSPDGKRVAFCTGLEGVSGTSEIYVRNLDESGSGLVKLNVKNAAIPRWRVLANGDTIIMYVTESGSNKDESYFKSQSTWRVKFSNGKFGKPEKIMDGAYHDGISSDESFAVSGARLFRVRKTESRETLANGRDTIWFDGEQACNVSLANDGSDLILFLDFDGRIGKKFVGKSYLTHERLLVANKKGTLVKSIKAPENFTFDHSEWALGASGMAVVTLANKNGAHTKIALVNIANGSTLSIVEGDELWHPCFWRSTSKIGNAQFDLDSAGVYYVPGRVEYNALELRVKMENFWERRDSVTAVALGTSRTMFGLYEKNIKSFNFLNMAYSAADMSSEMFIYLGYIIPHLKNLKVLVLEISPDILWFSKNRWSSIYYNVPGYKYDEDHHFWVDGVPEHFVDAVKDVPRPEDSLKHPYNLTDFLLPSNEWFLTIYTPEFSEQNWDDENFIHNYTLLKSIIVDARNRGLQVVCTVMPVSPDFANSPYYAVYGPSREYAKKILDEVAAMDVVFLDENKMGAHDYTDDMAYNQDHLSAAGAKVFTARLDSLLETLKK